MAGPTIRTFTVLPCLPKRLEALTKLAYNVWWSWHDDAVALFKRIDPAEFEALDHSPMRLLSSTPQARFDELEQDNGFLAHLDRVAGALDEYMTTTTWFQKNHPDQAKMRIAYFSMEFGTHESIPVYSGGLGILAGDHLKSASDLGIPLCGVSIMYREGYFRQYLNADGWQQERYPENDFFNLPLIAETDSDNKPIMVSVPLPGRELTLRVWRIQVGRVPLYLLDANIPENNPEDRVITAQLYGGDQVRRIQQEIVLGIGGMRALHAVGKIPTVVHMNEGHAAFAALERIRTILENDSSMSFATAMEAVKAGTCFTTHTPVPAGNDAFPPPLIDEYLGNYIPSLKISRDEFFTLGRQHPTNPTEPFGMTVLAIKLANTSNGVSKLHGVVSRSMWNDIWPTLPTSELPIGTITNGVHTQSWIAPELNQLFDRYIGIDWLHKPTDFDIWKNVDSIPDAELWRTHERRREQLIGFARQRLRKQLEARGMAPSELQAADESLHPDALTIGFARRFATYKRGDLIFRDIERLKRIVASTDRPIQFIFAGKAHPKDTGGKELIARVYHMSRLAELKHRVVFLEDYDMNIARYLVQGVDVWLNNPRRPLEASGTSGMKVSANGGLNLSILDGWWCEGYNGNNGWAIGAGEEYTDLTYQDTVESRSLYELIENDVLPLFYQRGNDGLPRGWIQRMKNSIRTLNPVFNTNRMVAEYLNSCYIPSHQRETKLSDGKFAAAKELAAWRSSVAEAWKSIEIKKIDAPTNSMLRVGATLPVKVHVEIGKLNPSDVEVQLSHGVLNSMGELSSPSTLALQPDSPNGSTQTYSGSVVCAASGQFGFAVRVVPKHANLPHSFEPGLVTWG